MGVFNGVLLWLGVIDKPSVAGRAALGAVVDCGLGRVEDRGLHYDFLLTGMQAISDELYHAAMVDGAGYWKQLRFITAPLLRRVALALVLSVIGSYLAFDQFFIMARGGRKTRPSRWYIGL